MESGTFPYLCLLNPAEDIFISSKWSFGQCSKAAAGWKETRRKESMVDPHCGHTLMIILLHYCIVVRAPVPSW